MVAKNYLKLESALLKRFDIIRLAFLKVNESRCIALYMVSGSIKRLFPINFVKNYFFQSTVFAKIYLFSIFFFNRFCSVKNVGLSHAAYIVIRKKNRKSTRKSIRWFAGDSQKQYLVYATFSLNPVNTKFEK